MKKTGFWCAGLTTAAVLAALGIAATLIARDAWLPSPLYEDQEVALDIPLGSLFFSDGSAGTARIELRFEGTPSNNVQFAVGRASAGGRLAEADTAFTAGWDCGLFFIHPNGRADRMETPPEEPGAKKVIFTVRLKADGVFTEFAFSTGDGRQVTFGVHPAPVPDWLAMVPPWDAVRVTSRGTGSPDAEINVRNIQKGVIVIVK